MNNRMTLVFGGVCVSLLLLALILVVLVHPVRGAGPWYVKPGGEDTLDCLSPATACGTIDGALAKASPGDTILVAQGTYTGTGDVLVTINKDIQLSGGWDAGFATNDGTTLLDGQDQRRCVSISSGITASMERFTIQGGYVHNNDGAGIENWGDLDFVLGAIQDNEVYHSHIGAHKGGGGIFNSGTLDLQDCQITDNLGSYAPGGGIYNEGEMTITDCTIEGNSSPSPFGGVSGGGILNTGSMTMTGGSLSNNLATSTGGGLSTGGLSSSAVLTNVLISENKAEDHGGGIYLNSGDLTISACDVISNAATYANGRGGGIYSYDGKLAIYDSLISNNQRGGAQSSMSSNAIGSLLIQNSTVTSNTLYGVAGASEEDTLEITDCNIGNNQGNGVLIRCGLVTISSSYIYGNTDRGILIDCSSWPLERSSVTISDTNIVDNQGWRGAGIYNYQGTLTVTHSAVISNVATDRGGGLYNTGRSEITNTTFGFNQADTGGGIYNTLSLSATHLTIYGNAASESGGIHDRYGYSVFRNSIIGNSGGGNCALPIGSEGSNIEDANTCGLAGPGDQTGTDPSLRSMSVISGTYVFPLWWGSPAVDSANPTYCPTTDQLGTARPLDGDGDGLAVCDVGAHEYELNVVILRSYLPLVRKE